MLALFFRLLLLHVFLSQTSTLSVGISTPVIFPNLSFTRTQAAFSDSSTTTTTTASTHQLTDF